MTGPSEEASTPADLAAAVASLAADTLGLDRLDPDADVFAHGADSMAAVRLLARLESRYGVRVPLPAFCARPTPAGAAALLAAHTPADAPAPPVPAPRPDDGPAVAPFPMTPTQQALSIGRGDAVEFGGVGCHGYFEWERDDLDVERFRGAWQRMVERHVMLRTVALGDGTQRVLDDPPPYRVPERDLGALPGPVVEQELQRIREEMSHAFFPPGAWPLFDLRVSRLPGRRVRVHLGLDLLVMDAWSLFQVLLPELVQAYEGEPLAPREITFRDYVCWRDAHGEDDARHRARAWWRERIRALPPAPDLPRRRAAVEGPVRFARQAQVVDRDRWEALQRRARDHGITSSCLLVAAFAEVLRAWAKEPSFTLNVPFFDRAGTHPDVDGLVGDFTNTLLLAATPDGATFRDRARDLQRQIWEGLEHREFNGVEVLRELVRERGGQLQVTMPIVVTSLLGATPPRPASDLGDEVYSISQTPQVLLDFQIRETSGGVLLNWDHVEGAFPRGLMEAMFGAFTSLLARLVDDEASWRQRRFDLMPEQDRRLRAQVNDTDRARPDVLLHELVAEQARRRPDAEAVVDGRRRLRYGQLQAYANRIGRRLRAAGVRPGDLVAVVADKGWEQYAAVYGILASGAAYLPLDAQVPAERLARLLRLGGARLVLTQSWLDARLRWPPDVERWCVDREFEDGDAAALTPAQRPDDLAYVIFTSGSTGEPKGVMVEHRGVANLVADVAERFGVSERDRAFGISGLHFDASVYDVFGPLAVGGTVVLPDPFERAEPDRWADRVAAESVTVWNSVPVLMELLVGEAERRTDRPLSSLRLAVLSGDWIPLTLPDRLRAQADRVRVVGSGGPTETICWSVFHPIGAVDPNWPSIPYGKPISNQRYYIVDRELRDRPVWAVGEMAVASDVGLARGYWADAERTEQRFVTLPETGERAYLTGDLGRTLPDGTIEILGREDFQVKIQGYRVELGEIEAALRDQPGVEHAVVVAPASEAGGRRLHAFVVGDGQRPDPEAVREGLRAVLPSTMVPAAVTALDAFPLTRNGKVDRRALGEMATQPEAPDGESGAGEEPGTALERVVCATVADVLGLPQVSPGDNFFRLGGDSLSGTRLAARLRELLGVDVPVRTVFGHPVVRELCARISQDPATGETARRAADVLDGLSGDAVARLLEDDPAPS